MNEKLAINRVSSKEEGDSSSKNSNSVLILSITERKSTMANSTNNQFNEKFEQDSTHNSSCLTADGCFNRHNIARKDEFLTSKESYRAELRSFSRAESEERRLISKVCILQKKGLQLCANETLEEYVERNSSFLNDF